MKKLIFIFCLFFGASFGASTATVGDQVTMWVSSDGTQPFTYQWFKNGTAITNPSATPSIFILTNIQLGDAASYTVKLTNSAGSTTTPAEVISVVVPPPPTMPPSNSKLNSSVTKKVP
jgi:hypothetical protein